MSRALRPKIVAVWALVLAAATACPALAATWYVGPAGSVEGQGTKASPWDLESALLGRRVVQPGDTIALLGGTYRRRPQEQFEVRLVGAEGKPIHVRAAPGERATIDGGLVMHEPSAHVWIWDLEILVSEPHPTAPVGPGSNPAGFTRPWGGLSMRGGRQCKYINLVIHDCRQGVSFWAEARDSEVYGCIIYDNGWPATDRGHGHAIYTQNGEGVKTISDCIMTGGHGYTMHAYGSERADVDNYLIEGNIAYDAGMFLVGGGKPSRGIRVNHNTLYGIDMQLGYNAPSNEDAEVRMNTVVNGSLTIKDFKSVRQEGNLVVAKAEARPTFSQVDLRPNRYDLNRAHLALFNWGATKVVAVNPEPFLKRGDRFRLMNPRDFYGKPVLEGVYTGTPIAAPVAGEFAAYVLFRGAR
jgi:hypothetical protein